jgi:anti-anti-sigma regulatory factor
LDRGPDWLFVRLQAEEPYDSQGTALAERVWQLLEQEFAHRLVVEMDDVELLRSHLIGELVLLHKRVCANHGIMRLSGLSDRNYDVLRSSRLHDRFPRYFTREEAVMAYRPTKPR